jgi:hypothetical protein
MPRIMQVDPATGEATLFADLTDIAAGTTTLDIHLDVARSRLLVSMTKFPGGFVGARAAEGQTQAQIVSMNLDAAGKPTGVNDVFDLSAVTATEAMGVISFANDLVNDDAGNVYVTDTTAGQLFKLDYATGTATVLSADEQFTANGAGLNGIAYHSSGYLLAVTFGNSDADSFKLFKITLAGVVTEVVLTKNIDLAGLDGVILADNGDLVTNSALQVVVLRSGDKWATATVVNVRDLAVGAMTTLALVDAGRVWAVNAHVFDMINSPVGDTRTVFEFEQFDELVGDGDVVVPDGDIIGGAPHQAPAMTMLFAGVAAVCVALMA